MSPSIRLLIVLHNHQPVGNFDEVFEQAYRDSYLPFLDLFAAYPTLKIALHTSGPLLEWLVARHPEYVDRLADFVAAGRIEPVGGAFYEPILTMLPRRDRIGQIASYTRWLERRLGGKIRGMWTPERVWEQSVASDMATAGIQYTVLDDFHFKNAGLTEEQLCGYYITEDDGQLLAVFPGSERLRYMIPFAAPQETIAYLRDIAERRPGAVMVFGDDGEKFGTWPETHRHVYVNGWLRQFFDGLVANQSWLQVSTPAEAIDAVPPVGKVYLPDASYREMTEWALPAEQIVEYERVRHEFEHDPRWPALARFVRGGVWRNFKVKYPEADEMYARMLMVSSRLQAAVEAGHDAETVEQARIELYRGQCNCAYWHGAFGGIYLPHLRNAVYNHLIAAENLLERAASRPETWVDAAARDFNLDARQEVLLANDKLSVLLAPNRGGQMYELDVRAICLNLLATLSRRPEAYHRKVLAGAAGDNGSVASIHDRVVFKQPGLDQRLQYDAYSRKSLLDHVLDGGTTLAGMAAGMAAGQVAQQGDFLTGGYEAKLRRNPDRIQVQLIRSGQAWGCPVKITKGVTLESGSHTLEIAYLLEGLPPGRPCHFGVEFNFAALPTNAADRFFHDGSGRRLGDLGARLDLADVTGLHLTDEWQGIDVGLNVSQPTHFWTFPIETVSQSEGGFELVHQSVAVVPHWFVEADARGRWSITMQLSCDASLAESRTEKGALAAAR